MTEERQPSERQREILRRVVEEYVSTGEPVGSKSLVERSGLAVSASTVRNDLAELETRGLLTHPHTSAGRVPTEDGYRFYADELLGRMEPRPQRFPLDLSEGRDQMEVALRSTTDMLSQVTRLLALVSAPPLRTATVRHVEVIQLRPHVVMVVCITSTGGVTKRAFTFEHPVDPGIASWANEYLNERLEGVGLGSSTLRRRFEDPGLSVGERRFLDALRPAFVDLVADQEQGLYVGGAASLLDDVRADELEACRRLLSVLERRAAALELMAEPIAPRRPFVRVGVQLEGEAMPDVAFVGATYGFQHRTLGAVGLLGPVRMDYEKALRTARAAAAELSRFVEDAYEER